MELKYPEDEHPLDDANILRSTVYFGTAQRAYSAQRILEAPLDKLPSHARAYLAVDAFMAEMTGSEDLLGWVLVLTDWRPGTFETCLARLVDKVNVNDKSELRAEELLLSLDASALRALFHIPDDQDLAATGFSEAFREQVRTAIPAHLSGLKAMVEGRRRDNRGYVVAFNKLKHMLFATPMLVGDQIRVIVPSFHDYDRNANSVKLRTVSIGCEAEDIRLLASRAVIAQAVLNSLLGVILITRYGEPYKTPPWCKDALELPGWRG